MPLAPLSIDPALLNEIHARVGQTLSQRYTLEEVVDVGGTCAVYRAAHRNGNRVAVKVLHASRATTKEAREQFLRDAYTANKVEHPAAHRILDDDTTEDGAVFVVMDYLEGQSLTTLLQRSGGGMSEKQLVPLMAQLCDVLAVAHDKGITHRALSPRKLFVDKDRTLHVFGFGTAATDPAFMAPEQARGETPDALTDLWAVGSVMFFALSGQAVYEAETLWQTKEHAATKPAPEMLSTVSGVDVDVAAIVDRAIAASPNDRWRNAGAMATALRKPLGAAFGTKTTAMMASAPPPGTAGPVVLTPLAPDPPPPPVAPTVIASAPPPPQQFAAPAAPFAPEPNTHPAPPTPPPPPVPPPAPYGQYPQYPGQSPSDGAWIKWVALAAAVVVLLVLGLAAAAGGAMYFARKKAITKTVATAAAKWDDAESPVPVSALDPMWGVREAPVTIVEFSDFQCPFCARVEPTLDQVRNEYGPEKVRIIWKHQPLPFHEKAKPAAEASQVVFNLKGSVAFFTWHDIAFKNQASMGPDSYRSWALQSGVSGPAYDTALLQLGPLDKKIEDDQAIAKMLGANGTPGFRINGLELSGAQPLDKFKSIIDAELVKAAAKVAAGTPKDKIYVALSTENYKAKKAEPDVVEDTTTTWRVPIGTSPSRGPADAPVTIVEFSDFQCPYCKKVEPTLQKVHDTYGDKVRIIWKDNPLPFHPRAEPSAELAREARAEKGDAAFWKIHDALFDSSPRLEDDDLFKLGSQFGLDAAKVKAAIRDHKRKKDIDADAELADDVSSSGTPSFFVNGRHLVGAQPFEKFQAMIDEELKKFEAQKSVAAKDYYASIQRDAKGPAELEKKHAPGVPSTSPFRGAKNAKVVIQEWADFQCPFCSRAESTVNDVMKEYGDRVKLVWRDKPLPMHPEAGIAAEAAREAFDQKGNAGFWVMHDSLFGNREHLKRDDLDSYATKEGLDMKRWNKALDGFTHKSDIDADDKVGTEIGITGTPAFLINDYYVSGAQPYPKFRKVIERALAESK